MCRTHRNLSEPDRRVYPAECPGKTTLTPRWTPRSVRFMHVHNTARPHNRLIHVQLFLKSFVDVTLSSLLSSAMGNRKPHFTLSSLLSFQFHSLSRLFFYSSLLSSSRPAGPFVLSGSPEQHLTWPKGLISDNVLIAVIHLHCLSQLRFDHPADLLSLLWQGSSRSHHVAVMLQFIWRAFRSQRKSLLYQEEC